MMYLRHVESNMAINEGNTLQNYYNQREKVICCVIFFLNVKNMLDVILEWHLKVVLVQTPCKPMIKNKEKASMMMK